MKAFFPDFTFVYGDAEFIPDRSGRDGLIALALHSEHRTMYMVSAEADRKAFCADAFCRDHIWSKLPLCTDGSLDLDHPAVMPYGEIVKRTADYFDGLTGGERYRQRVGFIADHATRDMQHIHDLFGNDWFNKMPQSIPRRPFVDLATLEDIAGVVDDRLPNGLPLPVKPKTEAHHALYDARWDREVHEFLMEHSQAVRVASGVERLAS